jgi:leucyl/phenylalanyl-tRNA--protein transferase
MVSVYTLSRNEYFFLHILSHEIVFPPVETADEYGLVAVGGDLSVERLLLAYKNGIFPWYNEDEPIQWWSLDPRCVLFPSKLKISKSMKQVLQNGRFRFTMNKFFEQVVISCKTVTRKDEMGTWINNDIVDAYTNMHQLGYAISGEAWHEGKLVGGLYGIKIGKVFFGESMFSTQSNASKFAFINLIQKLQIQGLELIDCQMKTDHMISLGAEMIARSSFGKLLIDFTKI